MLLFIKNKVIFYAIVILALLSTFLIYSNLLTNKKPAQHTKKSQPTKQLPEPKSIIYSRKVVASLNAGNGEKDVGIVDSGYMLQGPNNIFLDKHENIYIVDTANRRIKKFSKNGKFIRNIPTGVEPCSATIDNHSFIYVYPYNSQVIQILKMDQNGKVISKHSLNSKFKHFPPEHSVEPLIYGNSLWIKLSSILFIKEGKALNPRSYFIKLGTTSKQYGFKDQLMNLKILDSYEGKPFKIYGNKLILKQNNTGKDKVLAIKPPLAEGVLDKAKSNKKNIYISANSGVLEFTVFVYSKKGKLLSVIKPFEELKNQFGRFDWVNVKNYFAVSRDGTIYTFIGDIKKKDNAFQIIKLTPKIIYKDDDGTLEKPKQDIGEIQPSSPSQALEKWKSESPKKISYKRKIISILNAGSGEQDVGIMTYGGEDTAILSGPDSIAIDKLGYIYLLDPLGNQIKKFTNSGKFIKNIPIPIDYDYVASPRFAVNNKQNIYVFGSQEVYGQEITYEIYKINQNGAILLHYTVDDQQLRKLLPHLYPDDGNVYEIENHDDKRSQVIIKNKAGIIIKSFPINLKAASIIKVIGGEIFLRGYPLKSSYNYLQDDICVIQSYSIEGKLLFQEMPFKNSGYLYIIWSSGNNDEIAISDNKDIYLLGIDKKLPNYNSTDPLVEKNLLILMKLTRQ